MSRSASWPTEPAERKRRPRNTSAPADVVKAIRKRDGNRCIRCGRTDILSTQHRQPRGMGGTSLAEKNLPSNLITLCGSGVTGCHGWVESHRAESYDKGWLVHAAANPAQVAVLYLDGWWTLTEDGKRHPFGMGRNDHFMEGLFDVEDGGHAGGSGGGWGGSGNDPQMGFAWPPDPRRP